MSRLVFLAYLATFATTFAWPTIASSDRTCPARAGDAIAMVLAIFLCVFEHGFFCLWLVERTILRSQGSIDSLGGAIADNGSLAGWATYFGFRIAAPGAAVLLAIAVETACAPDYQRLVAIALAADAMLVLLAHAGTWGADAAARAEKKVE